MKPLLDRITLTFIGLTSAYVGVYAYFFPDAWYANFPGFGLRWLPRLGPYNEHLAADVGAVHLAFAVVSLIALAQVRNQALVRLAGAVLLTFNVLHLVYHLRMLHVYEPRDQVLNAVLLSLGVVLSAVLVIPSRNRVPSPAAA
ncbi:hypothetical protein V1227_07005 [Lentzea sp. DG1S-22]|uniref:hypothetical protein n=1 Tax=Lentzea sp. DG1S-22 TaxID=3108822 RepID=UPI002E76ED2B|nr:hypothetical protein [Lentzea sp. DG1S-22]WVH82498.1 hypothetical protein V1227_07005 [Lentzea sp. DG1S-22]